MRIFRRKNIDFVIAKSVTFSSKTLSKTLFCNQDHHQTLFLVVFLAGGNSEKFKFSYNNYVFTPGIFYLEHYQAPQIKTSLDQNHWLTPLEKHNFLCFEKLLFS